MVVQRDKHMHTWTAVCVDDKYLYTNKNLILWTDIQTGAYTFRQADKQMGIDTDGWIDLHTYKHMFFMWLMVTCIGRQTDGLMDRWLDEQANVPIHDWRKHGQSDRWTGRCSYRGLMDTRMDGQTDRQAERKIVLEMDGQKDWLNKQINLMDR